MKKVYQKCLWISYITLGIAVNEMGENINHDSNTNIKHIRSEASLYPGTFTVAAGKRYASHEGLRSRARRTDWRM